MSNFNIPPAVEEAVVTRIYRQADELRWAHLQDEDRTRLYQKWTEDPEIGGRLVDFVGQMANIRPWLKDCPMKEYARARRGIGKYSKYVSKPAATLEEIIARTLGPEWEVVPGTIQQKPMRALVRESGTEDVERNFATGSVERAGFKHLLWPAILDRSKGESAPWTICVVDRFLDPLGPDDKAEHRRVADFLGIDIVYFNEM
ncbi:hypothetical protein AB0E04_24860 [Streptomyces sp. NPDC048251]|uniref:hypothetical protein n=1 Tax=Streptomyces sp. NPDC048251 TaxID=3154501 RepID=UPI00342D01B9